VDDSVFNKIFSAAAGVWALVAMAAVALFRAWPHIMGRWNERFRDRLTEEAGDWDRIRSERDVAREERDMVRDRWAECEAARIEWMGRAVKAEAIVQGYNDGIGIARNEAQRIVSAEREADAKKRGNGNA
jgi:urease accessory protein UreF